MINKENSVSNTIPVITVDGPSGCGKGTLSHHLAERLGWHLLDSGALYRVLALAAMQHSVSFENHSALEVLARHLDVRFQFGEDTRITHIVLEGQDVSNEIRTEKAGANASVVAAIPEVRYALLSRQREFLDWPGLVADGRDMGTVVFPEAKLKIFLEADAGVRAKRRYLQLQEAGVNASLESLFSEINERDARDKARAASPLVPAKDAVVIDTTNLGIEEVVQQGLRLVKSHFPEVKIKE